MLELKATLALTVIGLRFDTSFLNIFFQSENIEPCYILLLKKKFSTEIVSNHLTLVGLGSCLWHFF